MRPDDGQVLHFSEDPTITVFAPHVARTARGRDAYVWAADGPRPPDYYWFPRQCPHTTAAAAAGPAEPARVLGRRRREHAGFSGIRLRKARS